MPSDEPQTPKFYVTTPIYYVNARPHIGHAYTTIVADVLARRHRLQGDDTFFLTGTDEHGQKIERSAAAAGIPPQQFTDEVSAGFRALWDRMGLTYNRYIRTTDPAHKHGAQQLFRELYNRGYIYLSTYTGSYCVSDEAFVDLPPGTPCPDCGRPLETVTEENFFFKLSEFQLPLLNLIESNELLITPDTARNEVLSFLRGNIQAATTPGAPGPASGTWVSERPTQSVAATDASSRPEVEGCSGEAPVSRSATDAQGSPPITTAGTAYLPGALKDLSVSRSSFTWGIPVPQDVQQASGTTQNHVIYVWLDALANYMTAIGYGSDESAKQAEFQRYWPADLHLVGKEITRFHCVYWPAFLLAAGLPTPKQITANGWLLFDNAKMSKSRGNVVRTETILDAFGDHVYAKQFPDSTKHERDLFAADVLRYFLLREIPFGQDGSFSFDALVTRYNADLANGYGNLVSRTLNLIAKTSNGVVEDCLEANSMVAYHPALAETNEHRGQGELLAGSECQLFAWRLRELADKSQRQLDALAPSDALATLATAIASVDGLMTSRKPWAATETDISQQGRRSTLYTAAEAIRWLTALLYPVLPNATAKVWQQLGLGDIEHAAQTGQLNNLEWGGLKPGTRLGPLGPIFPRADKSLAQVMIDMEDARNTPTKPNESLAGEKMPTSPDTKPSTDPGAAPRTSSLDEPAGTLTVGGSNAASTTLPTTPGPHTSAPASGPFAAAQPPAAGHEPPTTSETITIDDFMKVDLRVAQITACERIPKADKLLRLEVDLGPTFDPPRRQILSGIAQHYTPEELIGRRIVVVSNLAPRKMRGLDSHGMLLAASEGPDGKPILATFGEDIALGSRVR